MKRTGVMFLASAMTLGGMSALAQDRQDDRPPRDRPQARDALESQDRRERRPEMTEEQRTEAWKSQALGVAVGLNLSEEQTKSLTDTYVETRKEHDDALAKVMEEMRAEFRQRRENAENEQSDEAGDDDDDDDDVDDARQRRRGGRFGGEGRGFRGNPEVRERLTEIQQKYTDSLQQHLNESLTEEQAKKAFTSLGTFDRQWDTMAHAVNTLGLELEPRLAVLWTVEEYVMASNKLRSEMMNVEREERREIMQEMRDIRTGMNEKLGELLTEAQLEKYNEIAGPRRRFGRGGG